MARCLAVFVAIALLPAPGRARAQGVPELIARGDSAHAAFDPVTALQDYESALAVDSMNAEALRKASASAVDLGEGASDAARRRELFRTGLTYARRAVAIDSTSAEGQFAIARALGRTALSVGVRDRVRYAVEIREHALAALRVEPDNPGALHVLGMWNAEVKRLSGFELFFARRFLGGNVLGEASWKEAIADLERAAALDPTRLVHHLDLAGVYADTGERDKAREQYQLVIDATTRTDYNDPRYKRQAQDALRKLR